MAYTEIQKRNKKRYYYLAHTLRADNQYKKIRIFLGVDLTKEKLEQKIKEKTGLLNSRISLIKKTFMDIFELKIDFKQQLFNKVQLKQLAKKAKEYQKKVRFTDKDVLNHMRETFLIRYTCDTNASEGNTINLKETELILKKGIIPKSHTLREVHEIENTVKAYDFIERHKEDLSHKFILTLHKLVTANTLSNEKNEGKYRKKRQDVVMHGSKHFPPRGGRQIRKLMSNIITKYKNSKLSLVESIIIFHSALIAVHPFIDGNGRVSRLILNWMLMNEGFPPINLPSAEHIEYTDLMELSREGDSIPLAQHIMDKILNSYMSTL